MNHELREKMEQKGIDLSAEVTQDDLVPGAAFAVHFGESSLEGSGESFETKVVESTEDLPFFDRVAVHFEDGASKDAPGLYAGDEDISEVHIYPLVEEQ